MTIEGIENAINIIEKDLKKKWNTLSNINVELNILKMELNNHKTNCLDK